MKRRNSPSTGRPRVATDRKPSARPQPNPKRISRAPTIRPTVAPAAELAATIAPMVLRAVVHDRFRLAPAMAAALEGRDEIRNARDRAGITRSLRALLRWWGWIEPLHLHRPEEQLLLASLLDSPDLGAFARVWAERIRRPVDSLVPVGDAPSWTARAEGLKRWLGGRPANADPWRLFPDWIRDQLPVPPGDETPKARRLEFLAALQRHAPMWVGVRDHEDGDRRPAPGAIWGELRDAGWKPWIHRRITSAAKLPPDTDLTGLAAFQSGRLVEQDLASQVVGVACDPDPGERWWDVRGEADNGLYSWHLAALMAGKGSVTCTFESERRRHQTALRLRGSAFHNITTKVWDGHHPVGKAASFDGVLFDAPSSGVGTWRRHPDARWTVGLKDLAPFAARQREALAKVGTRVRSGGTLIYTVATLTRAETTAVVNAFLADHSEFRPQPFPNPLGDGSTNGTLAIWPHLHDCDARFIARMIRG